MNTSDASTEARPVRLRQGLALLTAVALLSLLAVVPAASNAGASNSCRYLTINTSTGPQPFAPAPSVWNWVATFEANPGGVPWYTHNSLNADEVAAAQRAVQTWENSTAIINFQYLGSTSALPLDPATNYPSRDGFNVIGPDIGAAGTGVLGNAGQLGLGGFTGAALDAFGFDVAINSDADNGGVTVPGAGDTVFNDFETIVLHELGHALGLDHLDKPEGQVMATRLTNGTTNRNPGSLDLECMQLLYGESSVCGGQEVTVDLGAGETPTDGNDVIQGTEGADSILAGGGDDIICGGGGDDRMWGQGGNDVMFGGDGNDFMRGADGNDEMHGGAGSDDLAGGRGNDMVNGDAGDDAKVRGGTGDDIVDGGEGSEALIAGNGGRDTIYGGPGNDAKITGGPRPDLMYGGAGNDLVQGFGGADEIYGDEGDDDLRGGKQADTIYGGAGNDICNGGSTGDGALEFDAAATSCESLLNFP